jgi:hypothetical protein
MYSLPLLPACQDGVVVSEWVWGGGWLRVAVTFGLPFGLLIGAMEWVVVGAAAGISGMLIESVTFGVCMAVIFRRAWPRGWQLPASDRVAVIRAVHRGERVADPRLIPEVLAYAEVRVQAAERDQRHHWVPWVFAPLIFVGAVVETVAGPAALTAFVWAVAAFCLGVLWNMPRQLARRRRHAAQAARLASGAEQ